MAANECRSVHDPRVFDQLSSDYGDSSGVSDLLIREKFY